MAKGYSKGSGKLDWKGVSTGTPCANPADNNPDYNKSGGAGDWRGLKDSTPDGSGKSQSIKTTSGGKD